MNLSPLLDTDLCLWRTLTSKEIFSEEEAITAINDSINTIIGNFEGEAKLFLSPSDKSNFRYKIATIRPYKANRTAEKPPFFKEVKEYLINERAAIVAVAAEADDCIASSMTEHTACCSYDKDLLQIPGIHFDFRDGKLFEVSKETALLNLYCQMLIGDDADNIPGIMGIGKGKAPGHLEGKTEEEMRAVVLSFYVRQYGQVWGPLAFDEVYSLVKLKTDLYK